MGIRVVASQGQINDMNKLIDNIKGMTESQIEDKIKDILLNKHGGISATTHPDSYSKTIEEALSIAINKWKEYIIYKLYEKGKKQNIKRKQNMMYYDENRFFSN